MQAILLGGLALKRRWQEKRKAAGITEAVTPNIVCSSAVHVSSPPRRCSTFCPVKIEEPRTLPPRGV